MAVDEVEERLDRAFTALGDPVRRVLVARLSRSDATVNELAEPFAITTSRFAAYPGAGSGRSDRPQPGMRNDARAT